MERVLLDLSLLVGGFLLLAKGADWLVSGSSELARRLGVRPLVVGLTVVAWGTSAPEVVVSTLAAAEGKSSLSIGNVLGSNVANIGLVLGACGMILPSVLKRMEAREVFWLLASLATLWWTLLDRRLERTEGGLLLVVFAAYNLHLYVSARRHVYVPEGAPHSDHPWRELPLGMIGIAVGARLIVSGAESLAAAAGISQRVIGLTVVALGTSLPELAAGIGSAIKKQDDLSVGNVVGSNVFNLLAVLGIAAVVAPIGFTAESDAALTRALAVDLPVVLAFSVAAVVLPRVGGARFGRLNGGLLLVCYAVYMAWLFVDPDGA